MPKPAKSPQSHSKHAVRPVWTKKIALSSKDCQWLKAHGDAVFTTSGTYGVEALGISDGTTRWKVLKGRQDGCRPSIAYGRVFMPKGERTKGGLEVIDCLTGKKLPVFATGEQFECEEIDVPGMHAVALRDNTVMNLNDSQTIYTTPRSRNWYSQVFNDKILWLTNDGDYAPDATWVCVQITPKGGRECFRSSYWDLGEPLMVRQDGLALFYGKNLNLPGSTASRQAREIRAINLNEGKRIIWSQVICGYLPSPGHRPIVLCAGDFFLHHGEVQATKGPFVPSNFHGLTVQSITTGKLLWSQPKFLELLTAGSSRFWVLDTPPTGEKQPAHVIALDPQTGKELVRIPTPNDVCKAVEHQDHLVLLIGKTIHCYDLRTLL